MTKPSAWKDLLGQEQPLLLPCSCGALSARLIERATACARALPDKAPTETVRQSCAQPL